MNGALLNSQPTSQPPVVSPPAAAVAHHQRRGPVLSSRLDECPLRGDPDHALFGHFAALLLDLLPFYFVTERHPMFVCLSHFSLFPAFGLCRSPLLLHPDQRLLGPNAQFRLLPPR